MRKREPQADHGLRERVLGDICDVGAILCRPVALAHIGKAVFGGPDVAAGHGDESVNALGAGERPEQRQRGFELQIGAVKAGGEDIHDLRKHSGDVAVTHGELCFHQLSEADTGLTGAQPKVGFEQRKKRYSTYQKRFITFLIH